jgi:hypothetical protein
MKENLTTYLNDHLAGSVAALELIDDLINVSDDASLKLFLANLKRDIEADQKILEGLLEAANEGQSPMRKAAAWVTEKFARAKFKVAGENLGGLGLVQAFEMLALGIRGKELLWRAVASSNSSSLRDIDFAKLEQRAVEQQKRVEEKRLEAARAAFS